MPMQKKFIKENKSEKEEILHVNIKNYVTPSGYAELRDELRHLLSEERPKIVETVRWAAGNGDRSENGDYIYGKKRLREIDKTRALSNQKNRKCRDYRSYLAKKSHQSIFWCYCNLCSARWHQKDRPISWDR